MGTYRLVDEERVELLTLKAPDDDTAAALVRDAAKQSRWLSRIFAVERDSHGRWIEVAAWAPRRSRPRGQ